MKYPEFIQLLVDQFESETQPFKKVHRLIDLAEAVIKFHTVVIVSDYLQQHEIDNAVKDLLSSGLLTPSLGIWASFTREIFPAIDDDKAFWPDFSTYFKSILSKTTDVIIPLRNQYAHGATPDDETCLRDIEKLHPVVEIILSGGVIGRDEVFNRGDHVIFKRHDGRELDVFPLMAFRSHEMKSGYADKFFFYNDFRNKNKIKLLNYDASIHLQDSELVSDFLRTFPLREWKKKESEFTQRISDLTDNFKGRKDELARVLAFVRERERGQLMIFGAPGTGKSALMAKAVLMLSGNNNNDESNADEHIDSAPVKNVTVIEYFVRRGSHTAKEFHFLKSLNERLALLFKADISDGTSSIEQREALRERLRLASQSMHANDSKLVVCIDGLDEADEELFDALPTECLPGVFFLCSSRETERCSNFYLQSLDRELRQRLTIKGLSIEDIRALLYESVNKYALDAAYIEAIARVSEGNPLYVELLCNALENNELDLNDTDGLPSGINDFYKAILQRLSAEAKELLWLLAIAQDYLTADTIDLFLERGTPDAESRIFQSMEVLNKGDAAVNVDCYQLFHESLRSYLHNEYPGKLNEWQNKVLEVCARWQELVSTNGPAQGIEYILKYYMVHLEIMSRSHVSHKFHALPRSIKDNPYLSRMVELAFDHAFRDTQSAVLKFPDFALRDAAIALGNAVQATAGMPGDSVDADLIVTSGNVPVICKLALHAGETAQWARHDVQVAFDWARQGRVEDAVRRVCVLTDEKTLFLCLFLILWIVSEERCEQNTEKYHRKTKQLELILDTFERYIPKGTGTVEWGILVPPTLMTKVITATYHYTDKLECLISRGFDNAKEKLLKNILQLGTDVCNKNRYELCTMIIRMIDEADIKTLALHDIATSLVAEGEFERAIQTVGMIEEAFDKDHTLSDIATSLAKEGEFERAIQTVDMIAEVCDKDRSLRNIATSYAEEEEFERAMQTIGMIVDDNEKAQALLNIATNLAKTSKFEQMNKVFTQAIETAGMIDNAYYKALALSDVALSLAKADNTEKSAEIFTLAIETTRKIKQAENQAGALSDIASSLAKAGYFARAYNTIGMINEDYYKAPALRDIALSLVKTEKAAEIYSQLIDTAGMIDIAWKKARALRYIAASLDTAGKSEQANEVFTQAIETTKRIADKRDKAWTLHYIATNLSDGRQFEKAIEIAAMIGYTEIKADSLHYIAASLADVKEFKQAIETATMIDPAHKKTYTMLYITACLAKTGNTEEAVLVFSQAIEITERASHFDDKARALCDIAKRLFFAGNDPKTSRIYYTLREITASIAEEGDFDQAVEISTSPREVNDRESSLSKMASNHAKAGYFNRAFEIAGMIVFNEYKSCALGDIATILSKTGKADKASKVFSQAIKTAEMIENTSKRTQALLYIAQNLAKANIADQASRLFLQTIENVGIIDDARDKARALNGIMKSIAISSMYNAAEAGKSALPALSFGPLKVMTKTWQQGLQAADKPEALVYLLRSLLWLPLNMDVAFNGVYGALSLLIRLGHVNVFYDIIRSCPQLGLDCLLVDDAELSEAQKAELTELERLLAEEEITRKGYERRKAEILRKVYN